MAKSTETLAVSPARTAPVVEPGRTARFWRTLTRNPRLIIGGILLIFIVLMAVTAQWLPLPNPERGRAAQAYQSPSGEHWLGTDATGRDVLARVIFGARVSLSVGLVAVIFGVVVGGTLGMLAGWRGGWFDMLVMRIIDGLLAFPTLLLAISITAALGAKLETVMLAIGIVNVPAFTRLARGQTLQAKNREFVEAARALGLREGRILFRHVMPNIINPIIVQASLALATAILAEASLSFLGLGAQPPTPTWGADINAGRAWLSKNYWWMVVGPGAAIMLTIYAFNLLGDGIRDILDPHSAQRR